MGETGVPSQELRVEAGLIVIGDEVLSGKVTDANTPHTIEFLRSKGIDLSEVAVIQDDVHTITKTVKRFSEAYDWVITSGGVGPTHDDLTMDGVAAAFGVPVVESSEIIDLLQMRGKGITESIRRLARVPEGFVFYWGMGRSWPVVGKENVIILPGVPQFFASCLAAALQGVEGPPFILGSLFTSSGEPDLVSPLNQVNDSFPDIDIGSYPKFGGEDHRVQITIEGRDLARVQEAMTMLKELLGPAAIVRFQGPS